MRLKQEASFEMMNLLFPDFTCTYTDGQQGGSKHVAALWSPIPVQGILMCLRRVLITLFIAFRHFQAAGASKAGMLEDCTRSDINGSFTHCL